MIIQSEFNELMQAAKKDPRFGMEANLLDLTERLWKHYGKPTGKYRVLYRLLEWSANKLIWRD